MRKLTSLIMILMVLGGVGWCGSADRASTAHTHFEASEQSSRDATVRVWDITGDGYGTGTYFIIKGEPIIVTAAHVVSSADARPMPPPPSHVYVEEPETRILILAQVIYHDPDHDISVIWLARELTTRKPLRYRTSGYALGAEVSYSGFPNMNKLLTLNGQIAGHAFNNNYLMQGLAWHGLSGASVFDHRGRVVGFVLGIDPVIKEDENGDYHVLGTLENLVVVVPATHLPPESIEEALSTAPRTFPLIFQINPISFSIPD